MGIDAVAGHHLNPHRSGVARFNARLAERLGVPVIGLFDERLASAGEPLLSFKVGELSEHERSLLEALVPRLGRFSLFLHALNGSPLEAGLIERADAVFAGNDEIAVAVGGSAQRAWAPGLISDTRRFEPAHITVFSFGMAHKLRVDEFARLRELLDRTGRSYRVYLSNANHETATLEDQDAVYDAMREVFEPSTLYFVGNLSDVAVYNQLVEATYFAAFFQGGVRANNTSINSAMEHGAVVITNLDRHSPPELAHLDNVIDIESAQDLPTDPLVLLRLSYRAMETARRRDWDGLVRLVTGGPPQPPPRD